MIALGGAFGAPGAGGAAGGDTLREHQEAKKKKDKI